MQEYERTAKFSVIKSHAHYFMKIHGNLLRKVERIFGSLLRGINYKFWKRKIKTKMAQTPMVYARSYTLQRRAAYLQKSESVQSLGAESTAVMSVKEFLESEVIINRQKGQERENLVSVEILEQCVQDAK